MTAGYPEDPRETAAFRARAELTEHDPSTCERCQPPPDAADVETLRQVRAAWTAAVERYQVAEAELAKRDAAPPPWLVALVIVVTGLTICFVAWRFT